MQTPLDLGTVDKAVYVTGVHCLSMTGSRSLTYYTEKEKKYEESHDNRFIFFI